MEMNLLESFFGFPSQVMNAPFIFGSFEIFRRKSISHDCRKESSPLSRIEPKHFDLCAHFGQQWRKNVTLFKLLIAPWGKKDDQ